MTTPDDIAHLFAIRHAASPRDPVFDHYSTEEYWREQEAAAADYNARRNCAIKARIPMIIARAETSGVGLDGSKWIHSTVCREDIEPLLALNPTRGVAPELVSEYKIVAKSMGLDMDFYQPFIRTSHTQRWVDPDLYAPVLFPWRVRITLKQ